MEYTGNIFQCLILFLLALTTWKFARRVGLVGLVGSQLLAIPDFWAIGFIALASGIWPEYDGLEVLGLVLWAFLFNCLLLPMGGLAVYLHWKSASNQPHQLKSDANES